MLRTRLTFGLMCLLIILLFMGIYSIDRCSNLGKRIEAISRDNDQAGRNIRQMKNSETAMTGALLCLVTGDQDGARNDFAAASKKFEDALHEENARASASPDEKS